MANINRKSSDQSGTDRTTHYVWSSDLAVGPWGIPVGPSCTMKTNFFSTKIFPKTTKYFTKELLWYINISYSWYLFNLFNFSISLTSFICVYLVLIYVYIEELAQQIRVTKLFKPAKNFLTELFISRIGYLLRQWTPYWKHLFLEILLVAGSLE